MSFNNRHSFTLIELLIVIGIIAIISVVVIVVLNPQELIKQARDSTRFSDMTVLERSLSIFEVDRSTSFAGTSTVVYVSVPDTSSTCANLGLPSLPSGWTYNCASTSTLQNVDGTGWIPANLTSISTGSPIDRLPIDPINTTSSLQYYTYVTGGSFSVTARAESDKRLTNARNDGGYDPERFEKGNDLLLWRNASGIIGYWPLDEGDGNTAIDFSGNSRNGTLVNSPTWQSESNCKEGKCLNFSSASSQNINLGTDTYIQSDVSNGTVMMWIKTAGLNSHAFSLEGWLVAIINSSGFFECCSDGSCHIATSQNVVNDNNFYHIACTWDETTFTTNYVDGQEQDTAVPGQEPQLDSTNRPQRIGSNYSGTNNKFSGIIDDVRLYNRPLSTEEIRKIYEVTR